MSTFNKIKCVQQMYSTFMKTSSREFYGLTKRIAFRIRTVAITKAYVKLRSKISTSQIFSAKVQDVLCKVIYCTFVFIFDHSITFQLQNIIHKTTDETKVLYNFL